MRVAFILVVLAQALATTAAPTKLSAVAKNIEQREADPDPQITNLSDHYLACYSSPPHGADVERDIMKRCGKEKIKKRDPQYGDIYSACYIQYGSESRVDVEKRCGKFKRDAQ